MASPTELDVLLRGLRVGAIDPEKLAHAAADWPADGRPGFLHFLAERGLFDAGKLRVDPVATATFDAAGPATASYVPEATRDFHDPHRSTPALTAGETPDGETRGYEAGGVADFTTAPVGGRYRVIEVHRTGGLGQVWRARDTAVGRDVALKTLRPDRPADRATRARFVREGRVTGQLEHPSIVPLYDLIDPPDGDPAYVTRFVEGKTLAEATGEYHRQRSAGRATRLDLVALLDSFVAVCRAVAFAHSRNVLHRDLKGQNVVLGDYGVVFLLDWGLAKEAGEADTPAAVLPADGDGVRPTRGGGIVGTPAFMAPEVATGRPASRESDVYSLGVVLYSILTGKLPYDGTTPDEVLQKVSATRPPRPRELDAAVSPPLEAICLKAMARDPAGRYHDAEELATEVRRWLADEPVAAFRDPFTVRAARWGRRHRAPVAAAAVFLVTAVVALAAGSGLLWQEKERTRQQKETAEKEWARAEEETKRAEKEQKRAEGNFATARTLAVDLGDRINKLETGLADPRRTDRERKEALDAARAAFDRFRGELPEDGQIQLQAALLHRYAGNVARLIGDYPAAEKAYAESNAVWELLIGRYPHAAPYRDNLAQMLGDLASLQKRQGKLREANRTVARAIELAEGLKDDVVDSSYRRTLGVVLADRADIELRLGEFAAAETSARQSFELLAELKDLPRGEGNDIDPLYRGIARSMQAVALRELARLWDALVAHEDAVARLAREGGAKGNRDIRHYFNKARLERAVTWMAFSDLRGRAFDDLGSVIEAADKLVAEHPFVPYYREVQAEAYLRRGELHAEDGRFERAETDLNKSMAVARELLDRAGKNPMPDHIWLRGSGYLALGRVSAARGKTAEAVTRLELAMKVFAAALEPNRDPDGIRHKRGLEAVQRELKRVRP